MSQYEDIAIVVEEMEPDVVKAYSGAAGSRAAVTRVRAELANVISLAKTMRLTIMKDWEDATRKGVK